MHPHGEVSQSAATSSRREDVRALSSGLNNVMLMAIREAKLSTSFEELMPVPCVRAIHRLRVIFNKWSCRISQVSLKECPGRLRYLAKAHIPQAIAFVHGNFGQGRP